MVTSGAGAAGIAIIKLLVSLGLKNVVMCDRQGAIYKGRENLNAEKQEMAEICNQNMEKGTLEEVLKGADVFIGGSAPGTVTEEKLQCYKENGVNRLSIGLQSVKNEKLEVLGRIHSYEEFLESYELARKAGFTNISVDLISSIPGQKLEEWKEELAALSALSPEHISVYQLIIEAKTPFYEKYAEHEELLPDEEESREIYLWTGSFLKEQGYEQYEISNYAKPGKESRHNLKYWERGDYLGLGLGAASMVRNIRMSNTKDMKTYLERCGQPKTMREDVQFLEEARQMEEFMFLGLRKTRGVSRKEFRRIFGQEMDMVYEKALHKCLENGMLKEHKDRVYLSEEGVLLSNAVLSEFLFD